MLNEQWKLVQRILDIHSSGDVPLGSLYKLMGRFVYDIFQERG